MNKQNGYHFVIPNPESNMGIIKETVKLSIGQVQELAEKHYKQAMKYVHRKHKQQDEIRKRKEISAKALDQQCSFRPKITPNKYNKKIQELKQGGNPAKEVHLRKWGVRHDARRREDVIKGQVSIIRSTVSSKQKQMERMRRSLQHEKRGVQNKQTLKNLLQTDRTFHTSKQSKRNQRMQTEMIPGVQKHYLNKIKAAVSSNNCVLFYKSDGHSGLHLESRRY